MTWFYNNYFKQVGIKFNIGFIVYLLVLLPVVSIIIFVYTLFFTKYWMLAFAYLMWIFTIDCDTCEKGGRAKSRLRKYFLLKPHLSYFPIASKKASPFNLDPKRNYLFCCFPHGVLNYSVGSMFATTNGTFSEFFPHHSYHLATLKSMFYVPIHREFLLGIGCCSVSEKSLNYLLSNPGGGKAVAILVGGAEECFYSFPGDYHLVLSRRKGFVRVALKNGSPLVPMFSFGVNDSYQQVTNSYIKKCQQWIKSKTGVAPIVINGRGIFQNWFGLVPDPNPINTIIGEPLDVVKTETPTTEQIDDLHERFTRELVKLFNEHKHKFVSEPDKVQLIIH